MLNQLKSRLQGNYTPVHVQELEQMETLFQFNHFNSEDGLKLGNQIILEARKYGRDLIVRIIRMEDRVVMFQYVGRKRASAILTLP